MLRLLPSAVLTLGLAAQQFTNEFGRGPAAVVPPNPYSVLTFADADADGDQDFAANHGTFAVLRQEPGRTWTRIDLLPAIVSAAAWADFDADGDLDLVVGGARTYNNAPLGILRNDGAAFTWRGEVPGVIVGTVQRLAIGDVDGDFDADVVVGLSTGLQVLVNQGNTTLAVAGGPLSLRAEAMPVLFDRDGDFDLDLAVASPAGCELYDNAAGVFTNISATLPAGTAGTGVAAGDLDGDGRSDLAFVRGGTVDVLWNQPNGFGLAVAVVIAGDAGLGIEPADLDGDGDRDLVLRTGSGVDWLRNDGNRTFTRQVGLRHGAQFWTTAMALGDVTGRGRTDVVCAWSDGQVRTLYGAAPQPFTDPLALPAPPPVYQWQGSLAAVGDVDGDGRPDLVVPGDPQVVRNDGRGRWTTTPIAGARLRYQRANLADLDSDGDLDLVLSLTSTPQPPYVPIQRLTNDGTGRFTPAQDIQVASFYGTFEFGDVDGDGDVDMLSPGFGSVHWFQNVGAGTLVAVGPIPSIQTVVSGNELVFEDLDGDGDADIVCGQTGGALPVFRNDGAGVFTASGSLPLGNNTYAWDLQAADLDGDGDTDIAVLESGALAWFRNQGASGFTRVSGAFPPGNGFNQLRFVDVDEDGDVDLYPGGSTIGLLANDGTGVFADATSRLWSPVLGAPLFADLDEDGDTDLLYVTGGSWRRGVNRLRGAESLQVVQPGGALQVRFHVLPHAPAAGALVLPLVAFAPGAAVALPGFAGRLLLPASATMVLGALGAASGTATLAVAVPPLPGFVGLDLCVQGLVLGAGVAPGFTNVVDERILP